MINKIQNLLCTVPTAGTWVSWATALDPAKAVVMMWGGGFNEVIDSIGTHDFAYAWQIYPVWDSLCSQSISVGWSETPKSVAYIAIQIIEYI